MPVFEIEMGGQRFEVDAPDMNAAMAALGGPSSFADRFGGMRPPQNAAKLDDELQRQARLERGEPSNKYSYGAVYPQMVREAVDTMSSGARQAVEGEGLWEKAKGAGMAALGGASYVASPINAALRVAVGNPVEKLTGVPRDYTEFAAGLAIPGVGLPRAATATKVTTKAPTVEALKDSYVAAKNAPEVEALQVRPDATPRLADALTSQLDAKKFSPVRAKETYSLLDDARAPPTGPTVTMQNIDDLRYQLGLIAGGTNKTDAAAAQFAKKKLDEWAGKIPTADVLSGDPKAAAKIMAEGRANYAGAKLAEALDKRIARAELQTDAANSGMNLQNKLRQKVEQFLAGDESRGLSPAARETMENFVRGGIGTNALRGASNVLGGGGGLGAFVTGALGKAASGSAAVGAALPLAGFGLKVLSNVLAAKQADRLSELIRANTPLGKQQKAAVEHWAKYAQAAQSGPMTPRVMAMLTIQSRNLANNLKDAGIAVTPDDIMRSLVSHPQGRAEDQ